MTLSINTVCTHVRNTYSKLSVNRRDQAIRKGRSYGLIALNGSAKTVALLSL
jgi:ATP/maltotriose-dependent transcriptional regulator MalT